MPRDDLARLAHEELRRLPPPVAPVTLLPRVRAAVQLWALRPWYARAWFSWPIALQAASIAILVGIVAGGVVLAPSASRAASESLAAPAGDLAAAVARPVAIADTTVAAAGVLWRALV